MPDDNLISGEKIREIVDNYNQRRVTQEMIDEQREAEELAKQVTKAKQYQAGFGMRQQGSVVPNLRGKGVDFLQSKTQAQGAFAVPHLPPIPMRSSWAVQVENVMNSHMYASLRICDKRCPDKVFVRLVHAPDGLWLEADRGDNPLKVPDGTTGEEVHDKINDALREQRVAMNERS